MRKFLAGAVAGFALSLVLAAGVRVVMAEEANLKIPADIYGQMAITERNMANKNAEMIALKNQYEADQAFLAKSEADLTELSNKALAQDKRDPKLWTVDRNTLMYVSIAPPKAEKKAEPKAEAKEPEEKK